METNLPQGSIRLNTSIATPRTSSNFTATEGFRHGLGNVSGMAGSVVRNTLPRVPGTAALSASLSETAANLSTGGGGLRNSGLPGTAGIDTDLQSLQDEMYRKNQELIMQQVKVGQETTAIGAQSAITKAWQDVQKNIISNIK